MIPLRDVDARSRGLPAVTVGLIALNVIVHVLMSSGSPEMFLERTWRFATLPANLTGHGPVTWPVEVLGDASGRGPREIVRFLSPRLDAYDRRELRLRAAARLQDRGVRDVVILEKRREGQPLPAWLTLLTSMFMHGDLGHILGNMLFLMVFGGRLEFRLGRLRYLGFYLGTGVLAGLSHVLLNAQSAIPTVGASGAISGLLGGYVLLFPHGRILTLVPIFIILHFMELPAYIFVGIWVLFQVMLVGDAGSVAVWAHLGGFVFGLVMIRLLAPRREPPRRYGVRPWNPRRGAPDPFEHFR